MLCVMFYLAGLRVQGPASWLCALTPGGGGGGSIKTTLYDPCFRSIHNVQGFPADLQLLSILQIHTAGRQRIVASHLSLASVYIFMYITDHTLHMYSVLFRQRSKQLAIIAILWFVFVSIVTASVTLVSCLIFQSILQCLLHSISQPPHIRYYNWTETTLRTPRVQSVTCLL